MIAIGGTNIVKAFLGQTELANIAIGDELLFNKDLSPYAKGNVLAYLDGIDNAGYGVHDSNATVWKNLAGNTDWDLSVHSDWQSNSLYFDGTWNAIGPKVAASDMTVECVFLMERAVSFGWSFAGSYPRLSTVYTSSTLQCYIRGNTGNGVYASGYNHLAIVLTNGGKTGKIYSNGVLNTSFSCNMPYGTSYTNNFRLCGYGTQSNADTTTAYNKAKIYRCSIYTRELSAEEIASNYQIDKVRFGI